jgi:hypothetical protein
MRVFSHFAMKTRMDIAYSKQHFWSKADLLPGGAGMQQRYVNIPPK